MTSKLLISALALSGISQAALEVPSFFSDGMVLQQQGEAKVWGWLDSEAEVTVTFAGETETTKPDSEGHWEVTFFDLEASADGRPLTIAGGEEQKVIKDVLVGEVWLASGQSNMEWPINRTNHAEEVIANSADPLLRVYLSKNVASHEPQIDFSGSWTAAAPESTGKMTAVGYYFAKMLRAELGVPVGIIECSWGGKPVEAFTSEEALADLPEAEGVLAKKAQAVAQWGQQEANHKAALAKWKEEGEKGPQPKLGTDPSVSPNMAATIYNGMIAPLVGYGAQGAIWYQGESNANPATAEHYEELLGCLVEDWRARWDSELAFYYVQLANFHEVNEEPGMEHDWVTVQDEMRRALESIDHSGMAVINEIGEAKDIHPRNKKDVGERLARWALGKDYGREEVVMSGPLYDRVEEEDGRMIVSFEHNAGLKSRDGGPLKRFEIQSEDGVWLWAQAQIQDGKVIVWSDEIEEPAAVRYAWSPNPEGANLVNGEGLPASCFTTEE